MPTEERAQIADQVRKLNVTHLTMIMLATFAAGLLFWQFGQIEHRLAELEKRQCYERAALESRLADIAAAVRERKGGQ